MAAINIEDLQQDPSKLVKLIEQQQEISILKDGVTIASVKPVHRSKKPFLAGTYGGKIQIPDDFDEPMEIVYSRDIR
jgi:antitoxin (DNA-binding transcriptional repressor) of toxin-antitoxin stability system